VGHTGAGKTAALALLHRVWDPTAGRILVDGVDTREVTLASLRQNIGVVFQESLLFNRSIAENLRVGKPDATQPELEAAARLAEAHDFILRQPLSRQQTISSLTQFTSRVTSRAWPPCGRRPRRPPGGTGAGSPPGRPRAPGTWGPSPPGSRR